MLLSIFLFLDAPLLTDWLEVRYNNKSIWETIDMLKQKPDYAYSTDTIELAGSIF